jgi:excisionase family DNA binding protein
MPAVLAAPLPLPLPRSGLLTTKQAAEYLGIKEITLHNWRWARSHTDLVYVKIGGAVRYRIEDLERWVTSRRVGPGKRK